MVFLRAEDPHDTAPSASQYHDYYITSLTSSLQFFHFTGAPSKVPTDN